MSRAKRDALPRIGQVLLQEIAVAQGSGLVGPSRPCGCGAQQAYHDQARRLVVQTSVGAVHLERRAYYRCAVCHASSYPLDDHLGLGQATGAQQVATLRMLVLSDRWHEVTDYCRRAA